MNGWILGAIAAGAFALMAIAVLIGTGKDRAHLFRQDLYQERSANGPAPGSACAGDTGWVAQNPLAIWEAGGRAENTDPPSGDAA